MSLNRNDIRGNLVEVIKPFIKNNVDIDKISNDTRIMDDLGVNSARMVDIILDIEDKFNIQISDEVAVRMTTVGSAIDCITQIINDKK